MYDKYDQSEMSIAMSTEHEQFLDYRTPSNRVRARELFEQSKKITAELSDEVGQLMQTIGPVLCPESASPGNTKAEPERSESMLVAELRDHNARLIDLVERVRDLKERCEL